MFARSQSHTLPILKRRELELFKNEDLPRVTAVSQLVVLRSLIPSILRRRRLEVWFRGEFSHSIPCDTYYACLGIGERVFLNVFVCFLNPKLD